MTARAWALFAAVSVVWGVPYLFIKLAVDEGVSPAFVAWSRVALAALLLLPLAWHMGLLRGLGGRIRPLLAFAICEIAVPFPLIAAGEQRISSSLAAILIAALPLVIAVLAIRFDPAERVNGRRLAGLLIGLGGVIALLGIDVAGSPSELVGALFVLVATLGYAAGPMIIKRHLSDLNPVGPVAAAMGLGTLLLAPAALLGAPSEVPSDTAIASLVVLGVVCSALAFLLFFTLITEIGPSRASVITYVNPVVAVALGVALLDERLGAGAVAGLLLILAGSWLSTDGRLPPGLARAFARPRARRAERRAAGADSRRAARRADGMARS